MNAEQLGFEERREKGILAFETVLFFDFVENLVVQVFLFDLFGGE